MRSWLKFVGIGYAVALFFEIIASNLDPQNRTFQNPAWPVFFVLWYGMLYSLNYALFRNRSLPTTAVTWAILGPIIETVFFKRLNLVVDAIIYAIMFTTPHAVLRRGKVGSGTTAGRVAGCLLAAMVISSFACVPRGPIGGSTTVDPPDDEASVGVVDSEIGIALTPRHFPRHTPEDIRQMFELGKDIGTVAVFIYPWSQADFLDVASKVVALSRQQGLKAMVGLGVTTLGEMRGKLDVPGEVRREAGSSPSFRSAAVREAFARDAAALAKLKPDYLCLATEINMLALANLDEYRAFAEAYKKIYPDIKRVSPDTKVYVSFQWDFLWMMDAKAPNDVAEHTKLIDVFRPDLDVIAFTSYPSGMFATPAAMPANYYARIADHTRRSDEILFMEIGWPTKGHGSEQEQVAFIKRLPALMQDVRPTVLAWPLLHDVKLPLIGDDLFTTGIVTADGTIKPGYSALKSIRH
jgi:hypothetical protein